MCARARSGSVALRHAQHYFARTPEVLVVFCREGVTVGLTRQSSSSGASSRLIERITARGPRATGWNSLKAASSWLSAFDGD